MTARIYRPARNAMQSGKAKSGAWVLVHDAQSARQIEPLMGYTGTSDVKSALRLSFDTLDAAEGYARRNGLDYRVQAAHDASIKQVSYSDNFRASRKTPWTH